MAKVVSLDDGDVSPVVSNWDLVVFDMLIKAYVKANTIEQGFRTFRRSVEVGFVPSVVALRCVDWCWEGYEKGLGALVEF